MQKSLFNDIQPTDLRQPPLQQCSVVGSPSCDSENEYSQGFKQNIQPVDNGEWRQSASIFATDADTQ